MSWAEDHVKEMRDLFKKAKEWREFINSLDDKSLSVFYNDMRINMSRSKDYWEAFKESLNREQS